GDEIDILPAVAGG
ncbi:MAG: hypothetical protein NT032_01555, partial [Actinobacteria bacterium]|nr:hypothetical protein [Actinomycetota bacterium]